MAFWSFWNNNFKVPDKPEDPTEQMSVLWDLVTNHIFSWMRFMGFKMNSVLAIVAIILALLAICVGKGLV